LVLAHKTNVHCKFTKSTAIQSPPEGGGFKPTKSR
jgi:hypothetical protein